MRRFPWLFDSLRRLSPRERRVVLGGAVVSAVALFTTGAVLPFARRWTQREAVIALKREQLGRLRALAENEAAVREFLGAETDAHAALRTRLLAGTTAAVAASDLQVLIQRYAEQSRVLLDRVDLVGEPTPVGQGLSSVPAQISAEGDVYGLVELLYYLQHGEKLLVVDEVRVSVGYGGDERRLSWYVRLHAPRAED